MKTLYIDCGMGAAGDMLTAALMELLPEEERAEFANELNSLGIPGVTYETERVEKCGIMGTHMHVKYNGEEEDEHIHDGDHHHDEEHDGDHHHDEEHDGDHHHDEEHDGGHHHDEEHDGDHHDEDHHHDEEHDEDHHHDDEHAHGHHHHSSMHNIEHIVEDLAVSDKVKSDIMAVYGLIAEAESNAHGVPVEQIHFHEVGQADAVADVTAVCLLMEKLAPAKVIASPVHVGAGTVKCAHGILPVPAPATAYILRDVPIYGGQIRSELCTPTGAALLKHFVGAFGNMPVMKVTGIGHGMGKKDFERANCVRAMLGETEEAGDVIAELSCNVDDMTAEEIAFAMEELLAAGALDVYTVPIGMKKGRPGTLISVMCAQEKKDEMIRLMLKNLATIGVRENISKRYTMERRIETAATQFGNVRKKVSEGYGVTREKYEYEDLARLSRETGKSLLEIKKELK